MNQSGSSLKSFMLHNMGLFLFVIAIAISGSYLIGMSSKEERGWVLYAAVVSLYVIGMVGLVLINVVIAILDSYKNNKRQAVDRLLSTGAVFFLGLVVATAFVMLVR